MKLLVLGNSNIFQRRLLPVLTECGFTSVDVASASGREIGDVPGAVENVYADYATALNRSRADIVYITTTNNLHASLAQQALESGRHVVVDKPAVTAAVDATALVDVAARKGVCLAEATVFTAHPQIQRAVEVFREHGVEPKRISSTFSMPPLNAGNFRYVKRLGGGAVLDTGAYAVTPGRVFFDDVPKAVHASVTSRAEEVETGYSLLMNFGEGRTLVGHFGFDTEYRNRIEVLGSELCVCFDRAFTTTPDLENSITVIHRNSVTTEVAPKGDSFQLFFRKVVSDIAEGHYGRYAEDMLKDAKSVGMLQKALEN